MIGDWAQVGIMAIALLGILGTIGKLYVDSQVNPLRAWQEDHESHSHQILERLVSKIEKIDRRLVGLIGELRGKGVINGHDKEND